MDPGGFQKCAWKPLVTTSKFYTKTTGLSKDLRLTIGCCNLGFPCIFSDSPRSIEYCHVFGFPMSWGSWSDRASAAPWVYRKEDEVREVPWILYWRSVPNADKGEDFMYGWMSGIPQPSLLPILAMTSLEIRRGVCLYFPTRMVQINRPRVSWCLLWLRMGLRAIYLDHVQLFSYYES